MWLLSTSNGTNRPRPPDGCDVITQQQLLQEPQRSPTEPAGQNQRSGHMLLTHVAVHTDVTHVPAGGEGGVTRSPTHSLSLSHYWRFDLRGQHRSMSLTSAASSTKRSHTHTHTKVRGGVCYGSRQDEEEQEKMKQPPQSSPDRSAGLPRGSLENNKPQHIVSRAGTRGRPVLTQILSTYLPATSKEQRCCNPGGV